MSNQPRARAGRVRVERGIYRRASGRYAVCVVDRGKPRLRTVMATTVAEAREQRELVAAAARRAACLGETLREPIRATAANLCDAPAQLTNLA
jgi:hypothetical protein